MILCCLAKFVAVNCGVQILSFPIIAARDGGGWMQILFFAVILLFSFIGSIIKAASKKGGKEGGKETIGQQIKKRLVKKFDITSEDIVIIKSAEEKEIQETEVVKNEYKAPAAIEKKIKATITKPSYSRKPSEPVVLKQREDSFKQSTLNQPAVVEDVYKSQVEEKKAREGAGKGSRTIYQLDSATEIRKAIVYYEILGKPLSLRDYPFYY